ncbi:MAG: endonuclease Q family protein, partial [Christensenella sp.]|uniref:endonuclease Q family protein n=1 Tax=Christensenella sp. TaxID=1935934 RepID=UPI002B212DB1
MFIADLHIHSKYSRATSKECVPEYLDLWARRKGIDLLGTGDFTHPAWREELKEKFIPAEEGLYRLKHDYRIAETVGGDASPRFVVSGEISSIYKKNGRVRKVHNVILLPSVEKAEALSKHLELIGNLHSDGRPILGLDSHNLLEITLDICPEAIFIPAHIWTPHFSLFGAYSGFDTIEECFEDLTPYIHALETGLSSDPPMNWRLSALDRFTMVSNSDAHSPANLAREANIFNTELSYPSVARALANRDTDEFYGTLEFFPEEGKYHNDGHRNCKVCFTPEETIAA